MKKTYTFLFKIILISFVSLWALPSTIDSIKGCRSFILRKMNPGRHIYYSIDKSNKKYNSHVLIIGDSVANQLYPVDSISQDYVSLCSNQAISLVGNYILLAKFLENNDNVRTVYFIYHPRSFDNNLNQSWTYNYFLKPFYTFENMKYITQNAKNIISDITYSKLVFIPAVRLTNLTPEYDEKTGLESGDIKMYNPSDLSVEYLKKMQQLTATKNIKLKVISPVMSTKFRDFNADGLRQKIIQNNLSAEFDGYFDFKYLDVSFFNDTVHYKDPKRFGVNPLHLVW